MFSLNEIDHVAWVILLLIGAWVVVNALVDLSGDRTPFSDSVDERRAAEERRNKHG